MDFLLSLFISTVLIVAASIISLVMFSLLYLVMHHPMIGYPIVISGWVLLTFALYLDEMRHKHNK